MPITKVDLEEPIRLGDRVITQVVVRSPKVREVRELERAGRQAAATGGLGIDDALGPLLILTDLDQAAADELDAVDLRRISEAIEGFFPQAPAGGSGGA